jgi:serine protease Do
LATKPLGQTASIDRLRGGESQTVSLPVEAAPAVSDDMMASITGSSRFSGTTVRQLDPALAEAKGMPYEAKGVVVTEVAAGSPADQMGLRVNDVIVALNDIRIETARDFAETASRRVRTWQIILQRDGRISRSIVSG